MPKQTKQIEIMSPVGSYESLAAAIQGGCNSIYFGIGKLNMRSLSTKNFTIQDLRKIVKICKDNNIKAYLTVNAVIYDKEITEMKKTIAAAKKYGVSAIIAHDQAVIHYCNKIKIPVHISTQANVSNIEAVKYYAQFSDVVVLARELNMEQVKKIYQQIKKDKVKGPSGNLVKIEMFVHGALCMSISGKCYLSLHHYNESANRGRCLQLCRRAYEVTDLETGNKLKVDNEFIMSPQDLCTVQFLDKIVDAGVEVLKIEGRARAPEYVKTVTEVYRAAADAIINKTFTRAKGKQWEEKLKTVFNRGFWDGYYLGQKMGEWSDVYGSKATTKKIYIGKGSKYFVKAKVGEFKIENGELNINDDVLVIGPNTGVLELNIKEIRLDEKPVNQAKPGDVISLVVPARIRKSDKLYKVVPA